MNVKTMTALFAGSLLATSVAFAQEGLGDSQCQELNAYSKIQTLTTLGGSQGQSRVTIAVNGQQPAPNGKGTVDNPTFQLSGGGGTGTPIYPTNLEYCGGNTYQFKLKGNTPQWPTLTITVSTDTSGETSMQSKGTVNDYDPSGKTYVNVQGDRDTAGQNCQKYSSEGSGRYPIFICNRGY